MERRMLTVGGKGEREKGMEGGGSTQTRHRTEPAAERKPKDAEHTEKARRRAGACTHSLTHRKVNREVKE